MRFLERDSKKFGVRRPSAGKDVGMVVQFTYENETKYALIADPDWEGKMHAIKLEITNQKDLEELLTDLDRYDDYDALVANYTRKPYVPERPYRTYLVNKVRNLKEVYLKG
jgi:hypothetical protein